ncbi:alpha/beta fold hydrolase [Candidatus Cyanaurora vandensis]|uniref:alpha/beta fold hydrolase n=1 Tax=Candidatus Cyanaurora vandensis TaxID=2714958 RepID=UPI00257AD213|nr:alpha/beta hydrolase [Candidatus Cyanaurora vandensis]
MTEFPWQFKDVQANGLVFHCAHLGEGPLLILLHGFPECWYSWRHQIVPLAQHFRVVVPDLRGYNLSSQPPDTRAYLLDYLVEDVVALARAWGESRFRLVGHDWGALIAWATALRHPYRVPRVAALQVPPPLALRDNLTPRQLWASRYIALFQIPGLAEWYLSDQDYRLVRSIFTDPTVRPGKITAEDIQYFVAAIKRGSLRAMLNYYRANFGPGLAPDLMTPIQVPSLFIYGEDDFAITPDFVYRLDRYILSDYQEVRIPACGHWCQQEYPEVVTEALLKFLR